MSKVPHLLKGSALPDGEQRRLAEYASAHPKSALHRKGKHHDAAVLLIHGIGYQNHGETLAYFGKPVAHSVQTLLALNTGADSVALSSGAPSEEDPEAEASARVRVELIPDGDTLPPAAEVNPLSHHSELTYSLTIERTEYPADPAEESPEAEEKSAQEEAASPPEADEQNLLERTLQEKTLLERTLDSARKYRLRKWAVLRPSFDVSVLGLPAFEGAPAEDLPKVELPKVTLSKVELPKIDLPNLEFPRLPQPKPRPVRTVTRRSLLFQEGFWRPRHYRPLKEHLPWLASVLPLFLMFCFYYERPGVTWRERAGHLLRSMARFMNVALWLVLAQLRAEGAVPELTAASVAFWGVLILVLMMSVRSACHLYVRAYAPMLQELDVADRCEISARGDSIGRSNITQPADVDVSFVTLPGPSVNSHMQYFDACSPVPLMLAHRLVPHMMPAGEQAQKAAAFTDIGTELNHGFARVKKWMRTMHYGLYAVLLLMLSVLLNVTSPVSLSALTGLDTSRLHSEGFDRLVADAQQLREQAGSSDLLLWILVGIFVVEALLMMVLSPWTQRRLQRAFMMRKVDCTGRLGEFNPLPMVTALLGLDGEDEDAEDAEEHNLAGEKGASQTYAVQTSTAQANGM